MSGLGCQTQVIHSAASDERGPVPCGHKSTSHRFWSGRCLAGGCGCPTYTPPAGQKNPPGLVTPGPAPEDT